MHVTTVCAAVSVTLTVANVGTVMMYITMFIFSEEMYA